MAEADYQKELDTVKADLAKLRSDVAELTGAVKESGSRRAGQVRETVEEELRRAREELRHTLDTARERGRRAKEEMEGTVGEHPYGTLLTAFGLGFIIAKLLDNGGRR